MTSTTNSNLPEPDQTVPYLSYKVPNENDEPPLNGKLYVYGDPSSPTMTILCAGFADDHTVFLPFAKALSAKQVLVGVMCIPGYDDRPEDGMPWENHPAQGFTFDETAQSVREAVKALSNVSTHSNPQLVGVFHDWAIQPGSRWAQQLEKEFRDDPTVPLKPDKMVFFDVLPKCQQDPTMGGGSFRELLSNSYMFVFGTASWLSTNVSKYLGPLTFIPPMMFLMVTGIFPIYPFEQKTTEVLYGDKKPGLLRMSYMMYMYRYGIYDAYKNGERDSISLHEDWKNTPVLYVYGKKKKAMYHSEESIKILQKEETENLSLCRVRGIEEAGHFFYVPEQKLEESLQHVVDFIEAENTFATN